MREQDSARPPDPQDRFVWWQDRAGELGLRRAGRQLEGPCPACGGNDRFSVTEQRDGAAIIYCRQCEPGRRNPDAFKRIMEAAGAGLSPRCEPRPARRQKERLSVERDEFAYFDADGRVVRVVVRLDYYERGKPERQKDIWQEPRGATPPEAGWPLYRLPSLLAHPAAPVLIVEGERTAEAAQELFGHRFQATTTIEGAGKAARSDLSPLAGRSVTVWPDNDPPGHRHAGELVQLCHAAGAASVRVVDVSGYPPKWDLADPAPGGAHVRS